MELKIVKLDIKDTDPIGIAELDTYYLVNPDKEKLAKLKQMIEGRFDYQFMADITDEEFDKAEELVNNIWEAIDLFISANFVTLTIDEVYEIDY